MYIWQISHFQNVYRSCTNHKEKDNQPNRKLAKNVNRHFTNIQRANEHTEGSKSHSSSGKRKLNTQWGTRTCTCTMARAREGALWVGQGAPGTRKHAAEGRVTWWKHRDNVLTVSVPAEQEHRPQGSAVLLLGMPTAETHACIHQKIQTRAFTAPNRKLRKRPSMVERINKLGQVLHR